MGWLCWIPTDRIPLNPDALQDYIDAHRAYKRAVDRYQLERSPANLEIAMLRLRVAKELQQRVILQHKLAVQKAIKRGVLSGISMWLIEAMDTLAMVSDMLV